MTLGSPAKSGLAQYSARRPTSSASTALSAGRRTVDGTAGGPGSSTPTPIGSVPGPYATSTPSPARARIPSSTLTPDDGWTSPLPPPTAATLSASGPRTAIVRSPSGPSGKTSPAFFSSTTP